MEERVQQFADEASRSLSRAPLAKEIASLRKFLYKNQEHRFTEKEKAKLFIAIQSHYLNPAAKTASTGHTDGSEAPALKLIDDALKMPFTVFSTTQKEKMLKWYWELLGEEANDNTSNTAKQVSLSVVDVSDDGVLQLMSLGTDVDADDDADAGAEWEVQLPQAMEQLAPSVFSLPARPADGAVSKGKAGPGAGQASGTRQAPAGPASTGTAAQTDGQGGTEALPHVHQAELVSRIRLALDSGQDVTAVVVPQADATSVEAGLDAAAGPEAASAPAAKPAAPKPGSKKAKAAAAMKAREEEESSLKRRGRLVRLTLQTG